MSSRGAKICFEHSRPADSSWAQITGQISAICPRHHLPRAYPWRAACSGRKKNLHKNPPGMATVLYCKVTRSVFVYTSKLAESNSTDPRGRPARAKLDPFFPLPCCDRTTIMSICSGHDGGGNWNRFPTRCVTGTCRDAGNQHSMAPRTTSRRERNVSSRRHHGLSYDHSNSLQQLPSAITAQVNVEGLFT